MSHDITIYRIPTIPESRPFTVVATLLILPIGTVLMCMRAFNLPAFITFFVGIALLLSAIHAATQKIFRSAEAFYAKTIFGMRTLPFTRIHSIRMIDIYESSGARGVPPTFVGRRFSLRSFPRSLSFVVQPVSIGELQHSLPSLCPDAVIIDVDDSSIFPPRNGLTPKSLRTLKRSALSLSIYHTLASSLKALIVIAITSYFAITKSLIPPMPAWIAASVIQLLCMIYFYRKHTHEILSNLGNLLSASPSAKLSPQPPPSTHP
jgi:hypothetical protein